MDEVIAEVGRGSQDPESVWPPELAEVTRLFPQFAILKFLGSGDVGAVYQAIDPTDAKTVVIKLLPPEFTKLDGFSGAFSRIAGQLGALQHPRIVPMRTFGKTVGGHLFIVSDFVDGEPLRRRLGPSRFIATQAYALIEQVCEALHFAHGHGVNHGGLHPGNVLIDRSGGVRVADFGLTQLVSRGVAPNGSENYAAPEQLVGGATDHRADIYGAGVLLYETLVGELPSAEARPASAVAHANARIDAVIAKAMSAAPEQRYRQAIEMMRAIIAVGSLDGMRPAVSAHPAPPPPQKPVATSAPLSKRAAAKKPRWFWAAAGGGAVLLVGGGALLLSSGGKAPPPLRLSVVEFPGAVVEEPPKNLSRAVAEVHPQPIQPTRVEPPQPQPSLPQILPGQWQKVELESGIKGATSIEGGGILLKTSARLEKYRGKDVAIRSVLRLVEEPKGAQLWLRANPKTRAQLTLNWKPACNIQTSDGDNHFKSHGETTAPWAVLGERWVTIQFAAIGDQLIATVNDRVIEVKTPSDILDSGAIGIFSPGAEFRSLEFALLDGVARGDYPDFVKNALDASDALLAKAAAAETKPELPAKLPAAPEPEAPKASSEVEQWLTKVDAPFRDAYAREVSGPFTTALSELRRGYARAVEGPGDAASGAGKLEEAALWRKEREVFFANSQSVPPDDADNPTPAIKALRAAFRMNFARLDRERFERGRAHFAQYDAVLTPNLAALIQRQRAADAALLQARRDELTKEWLAAPAPLVPVGVKPALGKTGGADVPKVTMKDAIDWLLENSAELELQEGEKWSRVTDARQVPNGRMSFGVRIDGAKAKAPPTADDLRRLVALRNVTRLEMNTQFPDSAFQFLRELSGVQRVQFPGDKLTDAIVDTLSVLSELHSLQLRGGVAFTGKTLDLLAKLPGLHALDFENSGLNDDGAAALSKIEAVEDLNLRHTHVTDAGLAQLGHLHNLKRLEIDHCAGITTEGLAALKGVKDLVLVDFLHDGLKDYAAAVKALSAACNHVVFTRLRGKTIGAEHLTPLTEWRSITHLALPDAGFAEGGAAALAKLARIEFLELNGATFGDTEVDYLLGLKELHKLNLSGTQLTDAGMLKFKGMKELKELVVNNTATTPGGVRQLEKEHPGCRVIRGR